MLSGNGMTLQTSLDFQLYFQGRNITNFTYFHVCKKTCMFIFFYFSP